MARVIVNADDFGLSKAINRAIARAHSRGVLGSCSALVTAPHVEHAVAWARRLPNLGVGLHLTLTTSLASETQSIPLLSRATSRMGDLLAGFYAGHVSAATVNSELETLEGLVPSLELVHEFRTQLGLFVSYFGRLPTHLDTHQHVHSLPPVLEAVITLAQQHALPVRQIRADMKEHLRCRGVKTTDRFVEAPCGGPDCSARPLLSAFIKEFQYDGDNVTELLVHPGFSDRLAPSDEFEVGRPEHLRLLSAAKDSGVLPVKPLTYSIVDTV